MFEHTQLNYDSNFTEQFPMVGNIEGYLTYTEQRYERNYSAFGWYAFPYANGSTQYYTTSEA